MRPPENQDLCCVTLDDLDGTAEILLRSIDSPIHEEADHAAPVPHCLLGKIMAGSLWHSSERAFKTAFGSKVVYYDRRPRQFDEDK